MSSVRQSLTQYPVRRDPRKMIAVASVSIIIIIAVYAAVTWWRPRFVVYTYGSFFDYGDEGAETVLGRVFAPFERQYGVDVDIVLLDVDANGIISKLVAEKSRPLADVVIGIDNILILQDAAKSVLEPYTSPMLSLVNETFVDLLDPEHYLTPFDFGLITLIYSTSSINTTTHPQLGNLTFADLADAEFASSLVTENPSYSSPGLSFLLSQIAVYEKLLHQDWTTWWDDVRDQINVQEGWDQAWEVWSGDPSRNLLVSYGTDPAYSAYYYGSPPDTAAAPFFYDNQHWAWMQVEGVGLVKNGPNPELGKAFIDYCLNATVQSEIALNQWVYPIRTDLSLPSVYQYAVNPNEVSLLNLLLNRTEISTNLNNWLDSWTATRIP
ncbi:MAG: thiamine ABC transporter substrate-binding protein [Candidatus Thorarchaeota archaeon]|nr:thiamine ABC transporter substrate-binding protein [Candidatus Thorarchaeota archaeon]